MGFGHLRRSVTLAHEILAHAPVRLWMLTSTPSESIPTDVTRHFQGLEWDCGNDPKFATGTTLVLDLEQDSHGRMLARDMAGCKTLALDWFDASRTPDVTINLLDHGGRMRAAYAACGRAEDYLEGPDYAIIRPGLRQLRQAMPVTAPVRRVIVTPGGSDPSGRGLEAMRLLAPYAGNLEITVIIGPLVTGDHETALRQAAPPAAIVLRNPPDFDARLAAADVVVCGGGGTLLEAMYLGKPVVVLPQTEAEHSHARTHAEAGACVFADALPGVFADERLRLSLIEKARARVDGRGAARIAEIALKLSRNTEISP